MNVSSDNDLNTSNHEETGKFLLSQRPGITCTDISDVGLGVGNSNLTVKTSLNLYQANGKLRLTSNGLTAND